MGSEQRAGVPTWDQTFMAVAQAAAARSKDPSTQVGASIAGPDHRILSMGYNGTPNGFDDERFPWGKTAQDCLDTKYPYVVHAERNAILNFRGSMREFSGASLYVTLFPCNECAKEIVQVGITEVVYLESPDWTRWEYQASRRMFQETGVTIRPMDGTGVASEGLH